MPAKKTATAVAAATRQRRKSIASLSSSVNGSETLSSSMPVAAAAPIRKAAAKPRTNVASTSLAGQQATLAAPAAATTGMAATSPGVSAPGTRARTATQGHNESQAIPLLSAADSIGGGGSGSGSSSGVTAGAATSKQTLATTATKTLSRGKAQPPTATIRTTATASTLAGQPSPPPSKPGLGGTLSLSTAIAGAPPALTRRPRGSLSGASASGPATSLSHGHHVDPPLPTSVTPSPLPDDHTLPTPSGSNGTQMRSDARPRRTSWTGDAAAGEASSSPPPLALVNPDMSNGSNNTAPPVARKRSVAGGAATAGKAKTVLAAAPSTAAGTAVSSVVSDPVGKKKAPRRSSVSGAATSTHPSTSRRASAQSSVGDPAVVANLAAPARDSSLAHPAVGGSVASASTAATASASNAPPALTIAALEMDSASTTALSTARDSIGGVAEADVAGLGPAASSTASTRLTPLSSIPRRSHGPVVSEEWTRSIIKPGDELLLYRPANAAFARTASGQGAGTSKGVARKAASKARSSPYDPQLRRAQQTLLQQRHIETATPGRRSSNDAGAAASGAGSVTSGGSASRVGSTVKRSGTRLQYIRQEAGERQRSLNATLATPTGDDGSTARVRNPSHGLMNGVPGSTSPTPSRMSEGSTNTATGGGGRLSGGTPRSRRSTGSNDVPIDQIPGSTSLLGRPQHYASLNSSESLQQQHLLQRASPSFTLFARPSPRVFSTPSPRGSGGSAGVPGLMTTFGVSNGPYYAGNEELTKLTRVREEMLRSLTSPAAPVPSTATALAKNFTFTLATASPKDSGDVAATSLGASSSSLISSKHVDPRTGETTFTAMSPPAPSIARRPRQRVYGIDIRESVNNEGPVSPQKTPAADVSQPRGRGGVGGTAAILASSIRQKQPGSAPVSPARNAAAAPTSAGNGPSPGSSSTRPKLNTAVVAPGGCTFTSSNSSVRVPRRSAVTVTVATLQPANVVAERLCEELTRQQQQQQQQQKPSAPPPTVSKKLATARVVSTKTALGASVSLTSTSLEDVAYRLLLDPLFPLLSEENYQRLLLQNNEYMTRKALLSRMDATPPPRSSLLGGSPSPLVPEAGKASRLSTSGGPRAARALAIDLAEAEETMTPAVDDVEEEEAEEGPSSNASPGLAPLMLPQPSSVLSPSSPAIGCGNAPRRPSVQYGGPTAFSPQSPSRVRSSSPGGGGNSPTLAGCMTPPTAPSPARDSKLLVNAVMPSEKTGPIKPLTSSNVWYTPAVPAETAQSSTFQPTLSSSNLNNGPIASQGNSPHRAHSQSPSVSRSSSRHTTRRGSIFHGAQQGSMPNATSGSRSASSDSDSTASDEVVDQAEEALRKVLPRWGPFRTSVASAPAHPAASPNTTSRPRRGSSSASTPNSGNASVAHGHARKGRKTSSGAESRRASADAKGGASLAPAGAAAAALLPPSMLGELDAYVHFFLKRFRDVDGTPETEVGPVPETPLALQRAIRLSLRLSTGTASGGDEKDDAEGTATELQDPLDDGSYHSQNVQYILDLMGALLQLQDSFCDGVIGGRAAARAARGAKRSKSRVSEADFLATVMWHPQLDKSAQYDTDDEAQKASVGSNVTRTVRKSRVRPVVKLRDPELRAVELMFVNPASGEFVKGAAADGG